MSTIGQRIKQLRTKDGLSLQALADLVGKSKGNISGYENDKYEPSAQTIIAIAKYFNVTTDWLLLGESSTETKTREFNISSNQEPIGQRIKLLRAKHDLSQGQLAKHIGVSAGNIGDWERKKAKPGSDALIELVTFFNVSADWLLTGEESSAPITHLTNYEQALLELFNQLSPIEQGKILGRMEGTIDQQNEKREKSSTCTNGNNELSATTEIA